MQRTTDIHVCSWLRGPARETVWRAHTPLTSSTHPQAAASTSALVAPEYKAYSQAGGASPCCRTGWQGPAPRWRQSRCRGPAQGHDKRIIICSPAKIPG